MKTYHGTRFAVGNTAVYVDEQTDSHTLHSYKLPHVFFHSPDGFEWGYFGSGPADLALSILADYFRPRHGVLTREMVMHGILHPAIALHQSFKAEFIAPIKGDKWEFTCAHIDTWLDVPEINERYEKVLQSIREQNQFFKQFERKDQHAKNNQS
ncbi:MAG: hypothetical protein GTO24_21080 [candidate division Zixibacteria bacterium]|nr:hypothetical protein [candidate division Zixibacteria bacterium]